PPSQASNPPVETSTRALSDACARSGPLAGFGFGGTEPRQFDALVSAALLVFGMRLDGQNRDVAFVRSVGPEQTTGRRGRILQIGLKNLEPVFPRQVINLMRRQAVVARILPQIAE